MLALAALLAAAAHCAPARTPAPRLFAAAREAAPRIWERLAYLCDRFGPRLAGSDNLDGAVRWAAETLRADGFENVRLEPVRVPVWERGEESAELILPVRRRLSMLGLGGSPGTPRGGLEAEVLVVKSFADLEAKKDRARGRIVLFDAPYAGYGESVRYRWDGPSLAQKAGAKACLIRSVASASLATPHTGTTLYGEGAATIPSAALTVEDSAMLARWAERGETPKVKLAMRARWRGEADSANVVAELLGREKPEEIVVVGGHIDSWDVGSGAHDDGAGIVAAWEGLRLLKELGMRPRRTLRLVLWTNEENGLRGGKGYRDMHLDELPKHVAAIEADHGAFPPRGFSVSGSTEAVRRLRAAAGELEPRSAFEITEDGAGVDVGPLIERGVLGLGLEVDGARYFDYHHSPADTPDKVRPEDLADCAAALAAMAYALAEAP